MHLSPPSRSMAKIAELAVFLNMTLFRSWQGLWKKVTGSVDCLSEAAIAYSVASVTTTRGASRFMAKITEPAISIPKFLKASIVAKRRGKLYVCINSHIFSEKETIHLEQYANMSIAHQRACILSGIGNFSSGLNCSWSTIIKPLLMVYRSKLILSMPKRYLLLFRMRGHIYWCLPNLRLWLAWLCPHMVILSILANVPFSLLSLIILLIIHWKLAKLYRTGFLVW